MTLTSFGTKVRFGAATASNVRSVDFTGRSLSQIDCTDFSHSVRTYKEGIFEPRTCTVVLTSYPWTEDSAALSINWGGETDAGGADVFINYGNHHVTDIQISAGLDAVIEYTYTFTEGV
ncbi:MAG: hypothetical protein CBC48_07720 [bacterium TMED88]|nr:hypothetical protein [Deltaproteobacteria bacterium]OUV32755.1 MAG: hypothetical protein CBC48_07720 [bacterium TMED88]